MDKNAIKKFAVDARKKLMNSCRDRAAYLGIYQDHVEEPEVVADGIQRFSQKSGQYVTISGEQIAWRESLLRRVAEVGFDQVIEETAYSWFNRLIAIRFMEVNGYLPIRVLSSEMPGKVEPDVFSELPDVDFGVKGWKPFSAEEVAEIARLLEQNAVDALFRLVFLKQCDALQRLLPGFVKRTEDSMKLLLNLSFANPDGVVRRLVSDIPEEDFREAVEIIGWLYQYYNSELKDETFAALKKNVKISKERIPAATQLFTPDWIVRYMVENSLGRLWLDGHPQDAVLKENWRYYLEEAEQEPEVQAELAKIRADAGQLTPEDITVLDPCMGSGHILVYAFEVLMDIYRRAGYQERDAARLIVERNLYGLDIDDRAGQLAYFAVMMKARKYNRRILSDGVSTHLASIAESNIIPQEVVDLVADGDTEIAADLAYLVMTFHDAKEYGSILSVQKIDFARLRERLDAVMRSRQATLISFGEELARLRQVVKQAEILAGKYDVVVTNPPYMGSKGMNLKLAEFVKRQYSDSKADLFAVFIDQCKNMTELTGCLAMITQHSWMFLSSFEKLRENLLHIDIQNMIHLGPRAFEEIGGEVVQTTSFVMRNRQIPKYKGTFCRLIEPTSQLEKEKMFLSGENRYAATQDNFSKIPGSPIAYWVSQSLIHAFETGTPLRLLAEPKQGLATGNNDLFLKLWTEVNIYSIGFACRSREEAKKSLLVWFPCNKGGSFRKWFGNNGHVVNWNNDGIDIRNYKDSYGKLKSRPQNIGYYFKKGITWSTLAGSQFSMRYSPQGHLFETKGSVCFFNDDISLYLILGLVNSNTTGEFLKILSPTLDFHEGPIGNIPVFDLKCFKDQVIVLVKSNIELSKTDWDSFETSWDFQKHPFLTHKGATIEESFQNWQAFTEHQFNQLKANEEELNRIFIDIYGLADELTPEVEDKDVTIRKADRSRDVKSFLSYAVGCMFGRYSLDQSGLAYAGGTWDASKYHTFLPDEDNIIPVTDTEYFNDDIVAKFIRFLKLTFGEDHLEENLTYLADALGTKGDTPRERIRTYFMDDFYKDHCKIYQKRPIYWLFDSGKAKGFKALIYLHRYNADTVGRVRTDYLHRLQAALEDGISRAETVIQNGNPAEQRKALKEKEKLTKQLIETRTYDMAIATIAHKRITLDLDDGVAVNYEKFQNIPVKFEGLAEQKINLLGKI